ncbi:nuclear transport factor 2 family protein [Flavobacterium sp.]|uniref:nuclear transport factor 2 family protein n=1 Tax=Flavobacterium sp. TaxID=239 RepID=UPI003D2A66EF
MRKIFILVLILCFTSVFSQEVEVKQAVDDFFVGLHKRDTLMFKKSCHPYINMQTIGKDKEQNNKLILENFQDFMKSIVSIPENVVLFEKLLDYKIQIDGPLAHVWTPYEFYVNGKLSHSGVNSFTLFKDKDVWQIIHIIDTRRK